ncbi:MAG: hypothetical protein QXP42_00115 [Candidatus Micrarchaeia archaeon]
MIDQSIIEDINKYGWAIFVIGVIVALMYYLETANPWGTSKCEFSKGFVCLDYSINTEGDLSLEIRQETGHKIEITDFACTAERIETPGPSVGWNLIDNNKCRVLNLPAGKRIVLEHGNKTVIRTNPMTGERLKCCFEDGVPAYGNPGLSYRGKFYIRYIEKDTRLSKTASAELLIPITRSAK